MSSIGQVHLYYGEGKGKTTAATGLAVRAFGAGYDVLVVQFLKEGDSSEMAVLKDLLGITVLAEKVMPNMSFAMTEEEKAATSACHENIWKKAMDWVLKQNPDIASRNTCGRTANDIRTASDARTAGDISTACDVRPGKESPAGRMLILDEIIGAIESGLFPEEKVLAFLDQRPADIEVVMTGRNPSPALLDRADYRSKIVCDGHPYNNGTAARKGIEF